MLKLRSWRRESQIPELNSQSNVEPSNLTNQIISQASHQGVQTTLIVLRLFSINLRQEDKN